MIRDLPVPNCNICTYRCVSAVLVHFLCTTEPNQQSSVKSYVEPSAMAGWLPMIGMTALPHLGGLYLGFTTRKEVKTWYPTLKKPSWRPPDAAFPVVWTCLYTGMGYGSYLIWKELGGFTEDARVPLGLYGLQLALNWAWTPIFFGAHKLKWALIEIVLLTGTVGATMWSWNPINKTATLLLAPYLAWLCLATSLNYSIWRDNPEEGEKEE